MNQDYASFLQTLKEKNDIVDVISSYIKLERRGYNYWACCPFHHEKTPSFSVNSVDKYYHCFGCGVSGNVISFVEEYENVDFSQAVEILAKRVGLEVPARDERSAELAAERKKKRDRHVALMKDAARFYLGNLYSGRADEYLAYLSKRGISPSVAKKFGLGASLDYAGLPSHLLALGYTPEECTESGACSISEEDGRLYDFEGTRLIIPIINNFDEVIAFGGRALQPGNRAKYKNTRETLLFNKSKSLYNVNLVKKEKRVRALPNLIMVEGYMDAISLYAAGFKNVVASMGTSLTTEQVRLAKRYTDTVLISYDGDAAGQSANLRGLKLLENEGMKLRVVPLPEGLDPDDVIRQQGAEGYQRCLDAAMPLIDFRIYSEERKCDFSKSDDVRAFVRSALSIVREAESETEREELLKSISSKAGISLGALQRDLEKLPAREETSPAPSAKREAPTGSDTTAARFVLCACLLSKPYALGLDLSSLEWETEDHRAIADFILREREKGKVRASGIFDYLAEDGEIANILNLDYGDNLEGERAAQYFNDCVRTLEKRMYSRKIAEERDKFQQAQSAEERRECLLRIDTYTKKMKNIGGTT